MSSLPHTMADPDMKSDDLEGIVRNNLLITVSYQ